MYGFIIFKYLYVYILFQLFKGGGVPIPSMSSAVPTQSQTGTCREDRYAALAELDNELSSSVSTGNNVQG